MTSWPAASSCRDEPAAVCDWVLDRTGNRGVANIVDWFVGRPFTILAILVVAWLVARYVRRAMAALMIRAMAEDHSGVARAGTALLGEHRREARVKSISGVVKWTAGVLIWVTAAFLVIGELGINLAPLMAGAGIAGVALGFGAQSLVKDTISGLFMLIEDQYGIGDVVDLGEATGVVERITLRTTVLRSLDGTMWHVPNGEVRRVGNRSQLWSAAVVDVLLSHDADLEAVGPVLEEAARAVTAREDLADSVLDAPQLLGVESIGPEGVTVRLVVKTAPGGQFALQRALRLGIKQHLDAAGIPTPTVAMAPFWTGDRPR
ncbi:mechanosensitive ion channel [soil metagenome]